MAPLPTELREKESPSPLFIVDKKESDRQNMDTLQKPRQHPSTVRVSEQMFRGLHGDLATC